MNLSGLLPIFDELPAYEQVRQLVDGMDASDIHALNLPVAAQTPVLAKLLQDQPSQSAATLLLTGRVDRVPILMQLLESWLPDSVELLRFPEPTPLPYDRGPWSDNCRQQRLHVLTRLMAGKHPLLPKADKPTVIITSARALLQKTLPQRRFLNAVRVLKVGQLVDLNKLLTSWIEIGYEQATVVEAPGQFSHRGGILDIFPLSSDRPLRIELFGDEIDTLRSFDPATQRTTNDAIERIIIGPAREAMPHDAAQMALDWLDYEKEDDLPSWHDDIPELLSGEPSPHLEYYLPLLYTQPASLLDYLGDAHIFVDDWGNLTLAVRELEAQAAKMRNEQSEQPPDYGSPLWAWDTMAAKLTGRPTTVLGNMTEEEAIPQEDSLAHLFQPGPRYGGQSRPFMSHLLRTRDMQQRTVVVSRQAQRLAELWRLETNNSVIFRQDGYKPRDNVDTLPAADSLTFVQGSINEGFSLELDDGEETVILNLFSDAEIFGWQRAAPRRRRQARTYAPESYFSDIKAGDFVVHVEYGVGRFVGLVNRKIAGEQREYLKVLYDNDDAVYVPVHQADRLNRWIGAEEKSPSLHRLGGKRWAQAKARAQKAIEAMADDLLELYSARETIDGHAYAKDTEWQAELEASFPYLETSDQLQAIADVKRDMEAARPMDRLICGDVGYGKTEVALRAAFKAVMEGKQVAVLVPTTVLAEQHLKTFKQRLAAFPVSISSLSRLRTASQQSQTVKGLREGTVDIVVGTHRLLSDDVSYKDLGLLIVDEEQRFGVSHKEKLKKLRTEVDVITLTATPIPRTLYMALSGLRDISLIQTAPAERLPVQTYVGRTDDSLVRKAILRELDRGGQVYFVHNRVQSIGAIQNKLAKLVPEARVVIGHGQMPERELEKAMTEFANGEKDVLLCTTIIESGLDIPNANTLVVDRAELFGLSQLYQLRGRVGRAANRAYAYFFHSAWRSLTADAQMRLDAIDEHTDLGSGYAIAMRDLEIRGAGALLGGNQSGHISQVGYDLYTRMLNSAIQARKAAQRGETPRADGAEGTLVDLPLPTYVPEDYVADGALRLRLYRRMSRLDQLEEIDEMAAELVDRFGPIPDPVDNLLYQLRVKALALSAEILSITTEGGQIQIKFPKVEGTPQFLVQRYLGEGVRVSRKAVWLDARSSTAQWKVRLVQVLEKLGELDPARLTEGTIEPS